MRQHIFLKRKHCQKNIQEKTRQGNLSAKRVTNKKRCGTNMITITKSEPKKIFLLNFQVRKALLNCNKFSVLNVMDSLFINMKNCSSITIWE